MFKQAGTTRVLHECKKKRMIYDGAICLKSRSEAKTWPI